MMKPKTLFLLLTILAQLSFAKDKPAYLLYKNSGKKASYSKMIKDLSKSDMVFFGEYHNNPISHWLQLEMTKSFFEVKGKQLFLGAEMFESGNQLVIDEYLKGLYPEEKMTPEITQLWSNFDTDYKPILNYVKEKQLRFVATNIPRRYAYMIYKKGLNALKELSPEALLLMGPDLEKYFDPKVKAYAEMGDKMGGHVPKNMLNIQTAQAAKDATMAHFSVKNFKKGNFLFHIQGAYHSNYSQGIIWWIHKIKANLDIKSVATVTASEWDGMTDEEKSSIANYIIVVADDMTKTH